MIKAITVSELIEKLKSLDPQRVVRTYDGELDEWWELTDVEPLGDLVVELIFQ
jgi:hypothetical protein